VWHYQTLLPSCLLACSTRESLLIAICSQIRLILLLSRIILQLSSSSTASKAALQSSPTSRYPASRDLAFIASLLYILSPSPATVASGYTEAPFAALTFTGILCLVHLTNAPDRERWRKVLCGVCATLAFSAATTLRSLGVLNAGMVGWLGVVLPIWNLFTARSHGISMVS
jgi:hypothetical protein